MASVSEFGLSDPNMKKQIIVIHGGNSFKNYKSYLSFLKNLQIDFERYKTGKVDWKRKLGATLGKKYEVIMLDMPNKMNAKYLEWKIWFEKFIPHLKPEVLLIGHSLGALFLVKYLSENTFPKTIRATFLIAASWSKNGFKLGKNLRKLERQAGKILLYHSKDDRIVPFADLKKYQKGLKSAIIRVFDSRGHFNQEKLPELIKDIKILDN